MKKIIASFGLVALSASGINAVNAQDVSSAPSKIWNLSASLRGFYDDNVNSTQADKIDSLGFEFIPGFSLNWGNDQTSVKMGYTYGIKWYENGPYSSTSDPVYGEVDDYDQNHTFDGSLRHAFSERYRISLGEQFALGQEPDLLRNGSDGVSTVPQRVSGDNYRNYATAIFNAQLTPLLETQLGYANELFGYDDPSQAGLMDRMGQNINLELQYRILPNTLGILGGRFGETDFTGDEQIDPSGIYSEDRNNRYFLAYLGVEHTFRPELSGSIRGGARGTDYYNDPTTENKVTPYGQASLRYTYNVESYGEIGLNYDLSSTDLLTVNTNGGYTLDAETFLVYASISHRLAPKLFGSLTGSLQNSTFNGGTADGETEMYYTVGVNLSYRFNSHFSANIGYNYDNVDSDASVSREYDRNRFYLGVTATY